MSTRRWVILAVAAVLASTSCASRVLSSRPDSSATAISAGFMGYSWTVDTITHAGQTLTPRGVSLNFSPHGQFGADDSINYSFGSYRLTTTGFATSDIAVSAVGYVGNDPRVDASIAAIRAITTKPDVRASVTGRRLVVLAGGYTLTCHRAGKQADDPTPAQTASGSGASTAH